jgi:hypothetical protein
MAVKSHVRVVAGFVEPAGNDGTERAHSAGDHRHPSDRWFCHQPFPSCTKQESDGGRWPGPGDREDRIQAQKPE